MATIREWLRNFTYSAATLGTNPWLKEDFREEIESRPTVQRAVGRFALYAGDHGAAQFYQNMVTRSYRHNGETIIGLGFHSVVLRDGDDMVRKIHHRTLGLSPNEQTEHARTLERRQACMLRAFPTIAVAQEFSVQPFTLNPNRTCVVARQPYISNAKGVNSLQPSETYRAFLQAACDEYNRTGQLPDIVGTDNILETEQGLRMVDTIPLSADNPADVRALGHGLAILALHNLPASTPAIAVL